MGCKLPMLDGSRWCWRTGCMDSEESFVTTSRIVCTRVLWLRPKLKKMGRMIGENSVDPACREPPHLWLGVSEVRMDAEISGVCMTY